MSASKAEKGPSVFGVLFAAVVMFIVGVVAGFFYLTSFEPVQFANAYDREKAMAAKENQAPRPGEVYYYRSLLPLGARTWEAKRQALLEGRNTSVTLSMGELNAWWASEFGSLRFDDSADASKLKVLPKAPSFATGPDDVLHIAIPLEVEAFGSEFEVICIMRGSFENGQDGVRFQVRELYLNNAALPWAPRIADAFFKKLDEEAFSTEAFEAYRAAWGNLDRVELGEAGIRFVLR